MSAADEYKHKTKREHELWQLCHACKFQLFELR